MCVHFFSTLIIWELNFKVQTSFEAQNFVLLLSFSLYASSPTFKLLSMASYGGELLLDSSSPWILEVASPIIFLPSPFCCNSTLRSKWLHWWRRSKAHKLHMELHQKASLIQRSCPNMGMDWNGGMLSSLSCSQLHQCLSRVALQLCSQYSTPRLMS